MSLAVSFWTAANKGLITSAHLLSEPEAASGNATAHGVAGPVVRHTREELLRRLTNQVRSSFVFAVMQTQLTLELVYNTGPLDEADPDLRAARCAIHLLNTSLNLSLLTPVWACPPQYRRRFEARPISFLLDATELDGKTVVWDHFGGLEKFLELLDYCAAWVRPWSGARQDPGSSPGLVTGPAQRAPVQGEFSPRVPPGPDPVSGFVRNRCRVSPDAQSPARSLYQAYRDWCWETGRQAMAQRSFGMGLTNMGFQRRRRGQGYHWWMGISLASEERSQE